MVAGRLYFRAHFELRWLRRGAITQNIHRLNFGAFAPPRIVGEGVLLLIDEPVILREIHLCNESGAYQKLCRNEKRLHLRGNCESLFVLISALSETRRGYSSDVRWPECFKLVCCVI